ncbi:MAG: hypothetical protein Phog2KO_32270 [Phototrophicaceae bacterium]
MTNLVQKKNQSATESVILENSLPERRESLLYQKLMARKLSMKSDIRILLIDDAETQFYLIEGLLMQSLKNQFKLDWSASLPSSLELMNKHDYDVCILDYDLGTHTALDFLNAFKENNISTPVIVMTGHGSFDVDVAVMNAGAVDFIEKTGINAQVLERTIRYAIQQAEHVEALRQSEIRFRAMVEKGSDLIIQLDGNSKVLYTSPSIEAILGYNETSLLQHSFTDYVHPDDLDHLATMFNELVGKPDTFSTVVYRLKMKTGAYRWFECVARNLLGVSGVESIIVNGRDITERRELLEAEMRQRTIAEALLDISIALNSTLDFDDVIMRLLDNIGVIIPHQSANVMLMDENYQTTARAKHGYDTYDTKIEAENFQFNALDTPSFKRMIETRKPLLLNNIQDEQIWVHNHTSVEYQSYLSVPIIEKDTVIGFINLESLQPNQFTSQHGEYLQLFASLASIAITNARAYEQAHTLAAVEERQRLARELHDAVSQTLFSASVIADSLTKSDLTNTAKTQKGLEKLTQLSRGALAEMRSLLVELRPKAIVQSPLSDLLTNLCNSISGRGALNIELEVIGKPRLLSPDAQLQLYRLSQEILNNAWKHSQASILNIELRFHSQSIEIVIADDGIGFDIDAIPADHYGISIMRERAEKIGANLTIDTAPEEGTYIHIQWDEV